MKTPSDGWDADEREALGSDGLRQELEALRAKQTLTSADEARLLARIQHEAAAGIPRSGGRWGWGAGLAAAAVLLIVGAAWMLRRGDGSGSVPPPAVVAASSPSPSPVFYLPLEKPAIKISPAALAYRGQGRENPLLADLKPAFDAFRADE